MTLQLKSDPTLDALSQLRPRIRLKEFLARNTNNPYNEFDKIRRQKIRDYYERQEQSAEKLQLDEPTREQNRSIECKMRAPARAWKQWDGKNEEEEWVPFSRIDGEFINIWKIKK